MATTLTDLQLDLAELLSVVDKGASGNSELSPRIVLMKRQEIDKAAPAAPAQAAPGAAAPAAGALDEIKSKLTAMEWDAIVAWHQDEMAKAKAAEDVAEGEPEGLMPMAKSIDLPEPVRKALEAKDAEVLKMRTEKDAIEKRVAALEDERMTATYIAKARDQMGYIPGATADELALVLKNAAKTLPAPSFEKLESILKLASTALSKSALYRESGAVGSADGSGAVERVEALAKAMVAREPKMSIQKARVAALDANPDLYREYREEQSRSR
jgi:hypothetical protein